MRLRLVQFERAEVGSFACEVVVDGGQKLSGIDSFGIRLETEVEIHRVIHRVPPGGIRRRELFEDVVVQLDTVRLLPCGRSKLSDRAEVAPVASLRLIGGLAGCGSQPCVLRVTLRLGR